MTEVIRDSQFLGYEGKNEHSHYFFGSGHCTLPILKELYPQYDFRQLHQVHGNELVESTGELLSADAHWTEEKSVALLIKTADCMPALFCSKDFVLAAHAGWRGVAANILGNCAKFLSDRNAIVDTIIIGPHIPVNEFEVGKDVAEQLLQTYKSTPGIDNVIMTHPDKEKRFVNLSAIAKAQIRMHLRTEVQVLPYSTLSDLRFHSFRRGQDKGARQYSFVARR